MKEFFKILFDKKCYKRVIMHGEECAGGKGRWSRKGSFLVGVLCLIGGIIRTFSFGRYSFVGDIIFALKEGCVKHE